MISEETPLTYRKAYKTQDLSKIISQTSIDIQKAMHHLNRITGKTDIHQHLSDPINAIKVLPQVPLYLCIPLKKYLCTLNFAYETEMGDLMVYLSTVDKLPDQKKHQQ